MIDRRTITSVIVAATLCGASVFALSGCGGDVAIPKDPGAVPAISHDTEPRSPMVIEPSDVVKNSGAVIEPGEHVGSDGDVMTPDQSKTYM